MPLQEFSLFSLIGATSKLGTGEARQKPKDTFAGVQCPMVD